MSRATLAALAALALLSCAASAAAPDLPLSAVTETQPYATMDEAAVAALRAAMPLSERFENGGFILLRDGAYYYSDPVSNRRTGHIAFRAAVPAGASMAAVYHTHPDDGDASKLFSGDDVREAKALGVPSYIGVMADGTVRRYEPGKTPARGFAVPGSPFADKVSDGALVTTILNR